jgi:DNA-binding NarL/FixJ family response regulator
MVEGVAAGESAAMTPNATSSPFLAPPSSDPHTVVPIGRARRPAKPVAVLIAHGQRLARAGLRLLIDGDEALAVAGEAGTGEYAVALARRRLPDIVVMDLELPGLDALEATRQITADPALSRVRVLVLTPGESSESILAPLRAGAAGLVVSDGEPAELLRAMRRLAAGDVPISPALMGAVIADVASRPQPPRSDARGLAELTAREREVVALVATGMNNGEIAQCLVISPATARTHVSRAMRKLDARDRAQLVAFAYRTGLATAGAEALPGPGAPALAACPHAAPRDRFARPAEGLRPVPVRRPGEHPKAGRRALVPVAG